MPILWRSCTFRGHTKLQIFGTNQFQDRHGEIWLLLTGNVSSVSHPSNALVGRFFVGVLLCADGLRPSGMNLFDEPDVPSVGVFPNHACSSWQNSVLQNETYKESALHIVQDKSKGRGDANLRKSKPIQHKCKILRVYHFESSWPTKPSRSSNCASA